MTPRQHMRYQRYWIAALLLNSLFHIKTATTAAFHVLDSTYRIAIRRTTLNREDICLPAVSYMTSRILLLKSNRKDHVLSLTMVKTRAGLEQRQESATPIGANDSNCIIS